MSQHPSSVTRPALRALALALACAFPCAPIWAQTSPDRIAELEKKLEASQRMIDALGQRVKQLEGKGAAAPDAAPAAPLAAKVADLEQQMVAIATKPEEDRGLAMHGFADVGLASGSTGRPSGATVGSFDLYMTPKFGDRVSSLIELNFEVSPQGDVGVDLERLQLGYVFSDAFTLWVGRFHTPYGYWNTAFHHGAQLQTSVRRPKFLDFEDLGGILPAHSVGLWGTGSFKLDTGKLAYDLYVANSSRIVMDDPSAAGTGVLNMRQAGRNDHKLMLGANLNYSFKGALDGLAVGVHALGGEIDDTWAAGAHLTRLNMTGAWATYTENDWEIESELYHFSNQDKRGGTGTHGSKAWYTQAGHSFGATTPFARYEMASLNQLDNYFAQQASGQSYKRSSLGLRYDLNPKTAVKIEAGRTSLTDRVTGDYTDVRGQLAVRF